MIHKNRPLYIFKYLWDHTDEEHPAIIKDILSYLEANGIHANRKTVAADLVQLQDCGFDVICTRSRQNQYFIGNRGFELAELKPIVDAVQAAQFLSPSKSLALIEKLSTLASPHQAEQLKRRLYVTGKAKTTNESVYYTVDLLHQAIQQETTVAFQYIEYTPDKKKVLKHDGQIYQLSPYDLVWNHDSYYVFGWSENHGKIVKFRVDRMFQPSESEVRFHARPKDYDIETFCKQVFMMYDGAPTTVQLRCDNSAMKTIIDRFGEDVKTSKLDDNTFLAKVEVSASPTFYAWIFTYGGTIQILSPMDVKNAFLQQLKQTLNAM